MSVLSPRTAEYVEPVLLEEFAAEGLVRFAPDVSYWRSAEGLAYEYDIQAPDVETEPEDLELVATASGSAMRRDVVLHAVVSAVAGRPALARLAQRVAQRADGWVFVEFRSPPADHLFEYLAGAGRCIRVDDVVYLDAAAMAAWVSHPDFHVVK